MLPISLTTNSIMRKINYKILTEEEVKFLINDYVVDSKDLSIGRWTTLVECIIKLNNDYYMLHYQRGNTEMQENIYESQLATKVKKEKVIKETYEWLSCEEYYLCKLHLKLKDGLEHEYTFTCNEYEKDLFDIIQEQYGYADFLYEISNNKSEKIMINDLINSITYVKIDKNTYNNLSCIAPHVLPYFIELFSGLIDLESNNFWVPIQYEKFYYIVDDIVKEYIFNFNFVAINIITNNRIFKSKEEAHNNMYNSCTQK